MKPFICNFWCIALYPKHLEEDSNSFITNARISLIELFGILLDKPIFLKIILNGRIDKLKMKFSIKVARVVNLKVVFTDYFFIIW